MIHFPFTFLALVRGSGGHCPSLKLKVRTCTITRQSHNFVGYGILYFDVFWDAETYSFQLGAGPKLAKHQTSANHQPYSMRNEQNFNLSQVSTVLVILHCSQWLLSIETINTALHALCEKQSEDVFLHWHLTQILAQLYSGTSFEASRFFRTLMSIDKVHVTLAMLRIW